MPSPDRPSLSKQLLVEGRDYLNFFEALAQHLGTEGVQIQNFGGVDELRGFLGALVNESGFREIVQSLGIVRDAETTADGAFQSVQGALRAARLPVPDALGQHADGVPVVAVLILPGGGRPGMLETLLCETLVDSRESSCVDDFLECIERLSDSPLGRPDKRRAQAWLATQPDPHVSVGVAAQKGY